jgi:hypothetical protein
MNNCPDFRNAPARMDDGRHFTDYRPRCAIHEELRSGKQMSNYDYRMYLTENATKIQAKLRSNAEAAVTPKAK